MTNGAKNTDDTALPESGDLNDAARDEDEDAGEDVFAGTDDRAKFREALARKAGGAGTGAGAADSGSKIHEAHGPAKAQRQFRRKSGG